MVTTMWLTPKLVFMIGYLYKRGLTPAEFIQNVRDRGYKIPAAWGGAD